MDNILSPIQDALEGQIVSSGLRLLPNFLNHHANLSMLTCLFLPELGFPRTTYYGDLFYGALDCIRSELNVFLFALRCYVPY